MKKTDRQNRKKAEKEVKKKFDDNNPKQQKEMEAKSNSDSAKPRKPGSSKKTERPYNPDVTDEDMENLQHDNEHTDGGDDQMLRERKNKPDFTGEDLDVPGSKKAKKSGKKGLPDEENQVFSKDNKNENN